MDPRPESARAAARFPPDLLAAATAGHILLTPNNELAAALFAAIEAAHLAAGRQIWPTPCVRDFNGWLREQHLEDQLRVQGGTRCLSDIEERELWRSVVEASARSRDFVEPAAAARAARRARRIAIEHGIPFAAIAADASEECAAFMEWNLEFESRLSTLGCVSADRLLERLPSPRRTVAWVDNGAWLPAARRWLERHAMTIHAVDAAPLASRTVRTASPQEELAAAAEWARAELERDAAQRLWLCIPDLNRRRADVEAAFDAALAPQRFALSPERAAAPYAIAGGVPLSGYAPVHAALRALEATTTQLSFSRFSEILRQPDWHASCAEAGAAAGLDVALRSDGPYQGDLPAWLEATERVIRRRKLPPAAIATQLERFLRSVSQTPTRRSFSGWIALWTRAIEAGPWASRARWSSVEFQAAERLRELLAELAMADAFFGVLPHAAAVRIACRAAREITFQPQTGVPPVWISGQVADPWLRYDSLWIASCDVTRWPPAAAPVPLLPIDLQRRYGVREAAPETQLRHAQELQRRWRARAAHCVFSYVEPPDSHLDLRSPLLREATEVLAHPTQPHWRQVLAAAPPLEQLMDEWAPPLRPGEATRGVASLRAQSRCAFRGFAEGRLSMRTLGFPVPGFTPAERGELVHQALEFIWSRLKGSAALLAAQSDARTDLVRQAAALALARVCSRRDPGARWRAREGDRLGTLLRRWLEVEALREPFEVEAQEYGADLVLAGLKFNIRIDRLDRLGDGARLLLDYKTGMAHADWRGARPDNPQLPLYAMLRPEHLVGVAYARVNAQDPDFVPECERDAVFGSRRRTKLEGALDFTALLDCWQQRLELIAAQFAAGSAQVAPTASACRHCELHSFCRIPLALDDAVPADE